MSPPATTDDTLFAGAVRLRQPAEGYRFNVDSVHLAKFFAAEAAPTTRRRVCDLGAGVGVIGLSVLHLDAAETVVFVEREPLIASLCGTNIDLNGRSRCAKVIESAVSAFVDEERFDAVICNPPYFAAGRVSPKPERRAARSAPLRDFVVATRRILAPRASAFFVYTAHDLGRLMDELRQVGLEPKMLRFVHAKRDRVARIVLVRAQVAKPGGISVAAPLFEDER